MPDHGLRPPNGTPSAAGVAAVTRPAQQECERMTSPLSGGTCGTIAVASGVGVLALAHGESTARPALLTAGVVAFVGALLALQLQAAILVLRDQRYSAALISACTCTTAATALVLGLVHEQSTLTWVVAAAVTVLYVIRLRLRPT